MSADLMVELAANAFFLVYLALTLPRIRDMSAAHIRANVSDEDEPVEIIFGVAFLAVAVAVGALFLLLNRSDPPGGLQVGLAVASVALGWLTIHTMASLHYANIYWSAHGKAGKPARGLDFPGTDEPNGHDFLYFGFAIGMTAQTSDIPIQSTRLRKATLLHAIVSFLFNTVLVAAAVNVAVSLGAP